MENSDLENTISKRQEPDFEDTKVIQTIDDSEQQSPLGDKPSVKKRRRWPLITLVGVIFLLLIAVTSTYAGYNSGIKLRQNAEATQIVMVAQEQYELGLQDLQLGIYDRARQRFEYVIQLNPNYPGVTEKLTEVLLYLNTTATPTLVPTPTMEPTPDLRDIEQKFTQAQQQLGNSEWTEAIDTMLIIRKDNPEYRGIEIDGMLFLALRNRGMDKILKQADLEGGLYDLTLAEKFGSLDAEAQSLGKFASLYITGASFWGLDWNQAVNYFSQVAPHVPNLTDGSGWTAADRYRLALAGIAYQMANEGRWCRAADQFRTALSIGYDAQIEQDLQNAIANCEKGQPSENQTPQPEDQ